ncbi:unnamed protein product [Lepeophtheirus salmonis]|uniref:(salmon louse) hypothetical protein n=1 Tax=Lepeophtheirus salmonis TaxID=72036 RepID=A0A7R8H3Z3_LEPSM|nr:unnamed protein product [Lepeophtheirus salmonis]CAF2839530.1 unnamed protein product [Lepeophtheirus salmonis]
MSSPEPTMLSGVEADNELSKAIEASKNWLLVDHCLQFPHGILALSKMSSFDSTMLSGVEADNELSKAIEASKTSNWSAVSVTAIQAFVLTYRDSLTNNKTL